MPDGSLVEALDPIPWVEFGGGVEPRPIFQFLGMLHITLKGTKKMVAILSADTPFTPGVGSNIFFSE